MCILNNKHPEVCAKCRTLLAVGAGYQGRPAPRHVTVTYCKPCAPEEWRDTCKMPRVFPVVEPVGHASPMRRAA